MKSAFTLIELLVVISIVSLLSSVVLNTLSSARQNAKDVAHTVLAETVRDSITRYYLDQSYFPQPSGVFINENDLASYIVPEYISRLNSQDGYSLIYISDDPQGYVVYVYYGSDLNCRFGQGAPFDTYYTSTKTCNF